jgi:hypothetical protein
LAGFHLTPEDVFGQKLQSGGSQRGEEPNRFFVADDEIENEFFSGGTAGSYKGIVMRRHHASCLEKMPSKVWERTKVVFAPKAVSLLSKVSTVAFFPARLLER